MAVLTTTIDARIFRAYDIRGTVPDQLNPDLCYLIGRSFGSIMREKYEKDHPTIVVGRDMRSHGLELEKELTRGLVESGCHVYSIGETPSPISYYTICTRDLDGSIQITGSHNEAEYNGLKLQVRDAVAFAGDDIQILLKRVQDQSFLDGEGKVESIDSVTPYIKFMTESFAGVGKGLKVAIDYGNGVAGPVYGEVFKNIGCEVSELYKKPDGTFPNHIADPAKLETLKDLTEVVLKEESHIGIGFDGDGDRVGVIDEKGEFRTCDEILLLLAEDFLKRNSGAPVIFTVSCSGLLESEVKKWGGIPIMTKVGHSIVENAMHEHKSKLAGEQSGHFFLGENYFGYDDAFFAILQVLRILSESGKTFSQLFEDYPKVYQVPEIRPACPDEDKYRVVEEAIEHFKKEYPVNTMDGARIDFGDGAWAGIRWSNTAPRISICIEARSEEKMEQIKKIVLDYLKGFEEIDF
ncbi:MAG: phosphomannomutase/phosphoglucomutase [Candidatus Peribacteraceae bacterium]|jgi:phosphomannomutase/phosphoglucomutase|nr:phosphomannomutase/phosphoglucomutase [Candidatus Peribacteraceae bacterium]MDP7645545.1 phosphomannomutase/phosphoglucomutase [Candidatus Peribacteraceae bacterium]